MNRFTRVVVHAYDPSHPVHCECNRVVELLEDPQGRDMHGRIRRPSDTDPTGYVEAAPGDSIYSTLMFTATEYWNGSAWELIQTVN
jgi:hypothetical protein